MRAACFFFLAATLPLPAANRLMVSVQWDWIRLPHAPANQLLRQHLKNGRNHEALRTAVEAMLKNKQAVRIDLQGMAVEETSRGKLESVVEKSWPTEHDPGQVSQTLTVQGPGTPPAEVTPVTPSSFAFHKLGRTAELEVNLDDSGRLIDMTFQPQWTEHLGDISYGQGNAEIKQPVLYHAELSSRFLLTTGAWQLAGLFTPPPEPRKGVPPELAPVPEDRVMLFVRASAPGLGTVPAPRPGEPDQVMVLAEWIDTDIVTAAGLLVEHPDHSSAMAMREAMAGHLAAGRARLLETVVLPCRMEDRSMIKSVRDVPNPTEFDAPQMPQTLTLKGPAPAAPVALGTWAPWIVPSTYSSFTLLQSGVSMEVSCEMAAGGDRVALSLAPEICTYLGRENFGLGPALGTQPRSQRLQSFPANVSLLPGTPALVATLDAPQANDALPGPARARKVLLFVTVIH